MKECLLVQPIHDAGIRRLEEAGVAVRSASRPDMATVAAEIGDAVAVVTRNAGLDARAMDAAPRLRVVGNHGVGLDPVDVAHATRLGIPVVNTPGANASSVAELAIALMLALLKRLPQADRATRTGDGRFRYAARFRELSGKRVGIVGFGAIGRRTAEMLRGAFDADVLVWSRSAGDDDLARIGARRAPSLVQLARESDVVSLHLRLTPETRGLVDGAVLDAMKPDALLINTARGGLVETAALVAALAERRIGGAGMDVFAPEDVPLGDALLGLENAILTPHIGGSTEEALERTALTVAEQVLDVLAGRRPRHLVDPAAWERRRR